jgi:hypothetical protein
MADGFIVRRGGKAEEVLRTATPDINFVSKTTSQIVVTFKNNDTTQADVFYGLTSPLTSKVTLATGTTSSNITFSGLDAGTQYTVSAYAIVTDATLKKIKSEVVSTNITTDAIIFTAATGGTTEEYNLDGKRYKSHTFTSNGTFEVTTAGTGDRNKVDYLIIAGGGGGGRTNTQNGGGGGGAGGYRTTLGTSGRNSTARDKVTITATSYGVTVGSGGAGSSNDETNGASGNNSSVAFPTSISTVGGGAGQGNTETTITNQSGGSGGGGRGSGSATVPGFGTADEGFDGGNGFSGSGNRNGGGGGGASQNGGNAGASTTGNGGAGLANLLRTGSNETRAGGGAGGTATGSTGTGGSGGGGNTATNASADTGSGGGGTHTGTAGSGSNGIVVIRYEIAPTT